MNVRFSASVFLIVFCCAYLLAFALDYPLFRYYPMHGNLSWGKPPLADAGPAMAWYGLLANAAIASTVLAICVPDKIIDKLFRNYLWLFPCVAMLGSVFLLRKFFA